MLNTTKRIANYNIKNNTSYYDNYLSNHLNSEGLILWRNHFNALPEIPVFGPILTFSSILKNQGCLSSNYLDAMGI